MAAWACRILTNHSALRTSRRSAAPISRCCGKPPPLCPSSGILAQMAARCSGGSGPSGFSFSAAALRCRNPAARPIASSQTEASEYRKKDPIPRIGPFCCPSWAEGARLNGLGGVSPPGNWMMISTIGRTSGNAPLRPSQPYGLAALTTISTKVLGANPTLTHARVGGLAVSIQPFQTSFMAALFFMSDR